MKKPQLIILTDLHGKINDDWVSGYSEALDPHFDIQYLDSKELAEIDSNITLEEDIHTHFVKGGLDKAVGNLLEIRTKKSTILAFSIGGAIAWKAALLGFPVKKLIAISSNRIRKEYQKPRIEIELYFGALDEFMPEEEWFEEMAIAPTIMDRKGHEIYKDRNFAEFICEEIIDGK